MGEQRGVERPGSDRRGISWSAPDPSGVLAAASAPTLSESLAALVTPALAPEGPRPLHYALAMDRVTMSADRPFVLNPPLGDGTARASWTVPFQRGAPMASDAGLPLVAIAHSGATTSFVDVVAAGCTSVLGAPSDQARLVEAMVDALLCQGIDVVCVGDIGRSRLRRLESLAEACAFVAEAPGPTVLIVSPNGGEGDDLERLVVATRRQRTAGVVLAAAHPDARLVVIADHRDRGDVFIRPATEAPAASVALGSKPHVDSVEIAVLGPVEIRRSAESFAGHPLLTELVVYLAMHPDGATTSAWETALWPERRMPPQTVANRLSEARRALGFASDGRPRLRKVDERHLVGEVTTDWERFVSLADRPDDPAAWHDALELIRGRPFADLHQAHWVALEGFGIEIEHAIVNCAMRFAKHALGEDDPDAAMSAAQLALRATPWDERLHRILMLAADAAGDRAGVEATFRHLALVLEIDGDPLRAVHPETARLYTRLSGRSDASVVS